MIINSAGMSMLLDMYRYNTISSAFTQEGQPIVTDAQWQRFWHIQTHTTNYLRSSGAEPFWKNVTLNCLDLMDYVGFCIYSGFNCNDHSLKEIWRILIPNWYYDAVWVVKSEKIMNLEIALAKSPAYKDKVMIEQLYIGNPWRLFKRYQHANGKYLFKSLLTEIDGFELDPEEMVYMTLNNGRQWRRWWVTNMEYTAGMSRTTEQIKVLSKTMQVIVKNKKVWEMEKEQADNPSPFWEIQRRTGSAELEQNLYQEMPITEGIRVKDLQDAVEHQYQLRCAKLGFIANSNEKKERLTAGENYRDLQATMDFKYGMLKLLQIFEWKVKERGWVNPKFFRISMSGLSQAEGLPDTITESESSASGMKFGQRPRTEGELRRNE